MPEEKRVVTAGATEYVAGARLVVVGEWTTWLAVEDAVEPPVPNWRMTGWTIGGLVVVATLLTRFVLKRRMRDVREMPPESPKDGPFGSR